LHFLGRDAHEIRFGVESQGRGVVAAPLRAFSEERRRAFSEI
jgi:hypothetical protein